MSTHDTFNWIFGAVPQMVVFDLDTTLWHPEIYEMYGPPFRRDSHTGKVYDCAKEEILLYEAVYPILEYILMNEAFKQTKIAVASRTTYPDWADQCLRLFTVPYGDAPTKELFTSRTLHSIIDYQMMFPDSKTRHFKELHKETAIKYEDMLFFDNEQRNIQSVRSLGVTSVYCPEGLTLNIGKKGWKSSKGYIMERRKIMDRIRKINREEHE